jgi:hypothetical protein
MKNIFRRTSPIITPSTLEDLHDHLRSVWPLWINFVLQQKTCKLLGVLHCESLRLYDESNHPSYYEIWPTHRDDLTSPLDPSFDIIDVEHRIAILSDNKCSGFCYVFFETVKRLLKYFPGIEVEWKRVCVKPTRVYLWHGKEDPQLQTSHDFLLITLANGTQFCLDMTGSQFGIWGWLMKKGYYYRTYVVAGTEIKVNFEKERLRILHKAVVRKNERAARLRGWRKQLANKSDMALKGYTGGSDLAKFRKFERETRSDRN